MSTNRNSASAAATEVQVARESVDDALMIVASYGPWGADLNDAHRRQIVLADEVHRLRHLYEMAVHGRAEMRAALRQLSDALRAALAEPAEQEAVAWSVLDKRTGKHWYTHESKYTAQHYANEYSHREPDGSPSMVVTPLYTAPQPQPDDTALLQQCLEALDAALSDDKPYIKECKEAVAAIKERLK